MRSEEDIHRMYIKGINVLEFFFGTRWRIHPEWLYCKHSTKSFITPEDELLHFLGKMNKPGWHWPQSRTPLPSDQQAYCK